MKIQTPTNTPTVLAEYTDPSYPGCHLFLLKRTWGATSLVPTTLDLFISEDDGATYRTYRCADTQDAAEYAAEFYRDIDSRPEVSREARGLRA